MNYVIISSKEVSQQLQFNATIDFIISKNKLHASHMMLFHTLQVKQLILEVSARYQFQKRFTT